MADQPKSTSDILASIRKKAAGGGEGEATPPPAAAPVEPPAAESAPAPEAAAPKGTASILDSIRAKGAAPAGGAAAPAAKAPAAAGGAAPKGTASILSSIRGGGAGAPTAPAAAKTGAPKPAAAAVATGDKPSVQEMLKAVKAGVKAPEPGKPKMPPRLPGGKPDVINVKPGAGRPVAKPTPRRGVFAPIIALVATPYYFAWTAMSVITGLLTLKTAQFMMPNMVLELPSKFKVGVPSDFPLGSVSEKYKAARGVWIVHTDAYDGKNTVYALASVCTHLGCTPNWLEGEQKFKCPCHGSGFYISGVNFEGPAPRPLERVGIRVSEDGQLEVDKSVKFQEELGQWADGKSFVELA